MKKLDRRDILKMLSVGSLAPLFYGCEAAQTMVDIGAELGRSTSLITDEQANFIRTSNKAIAKTFEDFTPEQEYYIGRTVGTQVLQRYPVYNNAKLNDYINKIGQCLAMYSDLPQTFNGYHFQVLNHNDINAFAAPGGLIFVTRGLLRCCKDEDMIAAVLAHEIGHVQHQHGLQAIKASRITDAFNVIATEGAKTFGDAEVKELVGTFEGSIHDITSTMINNGYSRSQEYDADLAAYNILKRCGYQPSGLMKMLSEMKIRLKHGGLDFFKTHPSPDKRKAELRETCQFTRFVSNPKRYNRFSAHMKGV